MSNVRSRRSNRGNNLSKLINQERELLEENGTSISLQDNDDVINLLFNEDDEEDVDMEVSNEEINNNDDEFSASGSSSDDDDSEYDDSDNETNKKRKRKQQQLKSKTGFKRSKDIPILIKRKSTKSTNNKRSRASSESVEPIDLMSTENRRTSSRKSALENRLKVYNNLKEKEENRVKNFARHNSWRSKKIELKLTQEDRMKEALETEKINIASLQRFREVEIYQKLQREELHKRNKIKFTNFEKILRFSSEETLVTPEDDLKLYEIQTQNIVKHLNRSAK
ncbi:YL1 nuclear, partial [Hanseniaspora valbyensis NRRL Y-1626]